MYEFCTDYEKMFENIVASAYTYIAASKVKSLVIGISGGIDSTITAALAHEVVKRLDTGVSLRARIISIESDEEEMARATRACFAFSNGYQHINLDSLYHDTVLKTMTEYPIPEDEFKAKVRMGNIKARMRMIQLYDLANKLDGLVLSTDNYTEYLLGFWTLHGDVGDFGMIQNLWKTEVYGLAEYIKSRFNLSGQYVKADSMRECVDAMPTDGLGVSNSDFDQIYPGYNKNMSARETYQEVDGILTGYLNYFDVESYGKDVIDRHKATKFKRNNPFNIPREYIVK